MSKFKIEKTGKYSSYKIRLSQLITTYGPGAIVDFVEQPLMTADPKLWRSCDTIHDERLEEVLGVDSFKLHKDETGNSGVPFVRFPRWYFCPICKELKPLSEWEKDYKKNFSMNKGKEFMLKPVCSKLNCKGVNLVAPSILVACKNGHIDDFPWVEWVHMYKGSKCNNPKLKIVSNSNSLGLESFKVKCECGEINSLEGAFKEDAFENSKKINEEYRELFKCKGKLQWKGIKDKECGLYPRAVLRNASNIYFSKIETSLVIPPYSNELNTLINESSGLEFLLNYINMKKEMGETGEITGKELDYHIEKIANEIAKLDSIDLIKSIVRRRIDKNSNCDNDINKKNKNEYKLEEYNALMGRIEPENFTTRDFKIDKRLGDEYKIEEIASVTLVKRLREVRALIGFTRLNPPNNHIMGNDASDNGCRIVDIKPNGENWYPAYEVRGEGIFIEINSELIDNWLKDNKEAEMRANKLSKKYNEEKSDETKREITPKFIMLHTLAHLIIKELSFECGYSVTSLRERIYCDLPGEDEVMNGILIYTADGDSEGSLGGLVKQGNKEILPKLFINAIKRAKWCSYDPVCINSEGQGRRSQNLAACHSCTLLPETSCEEFNVLLDRALIVGKLENKRLGFLSSYI